MATAPLITYLDDHLAGATAALQLVDHLIDSAENTETKQFFTTLRADIDEDRALLEDLVHRMGGRDSTLRNIGGWVAEKIGWLKLQFDDPARGTLQRLEALEVLVLGIHGKLGLWRALRALPVSLPQLAGVDLARLEQRAEDQHERVEGRRLQAARRVLTTDDVPAAVPNQVR